MCVFGCVICVYHGGSAIVVLGTVSYSFSGVLNNQMFSEIRYLASRKE